MFPYDARGVIYIYQYELLNIIFYSSQAEMDKIALLFPNQTVSTNFTDTTRIY